MRKRAIAAAKSAAGVIATAGILVVITATLVGVALTAEEIDGNNIER